MSSIEERIQKHKDLAEKYDKKASNCRSWAIHNESKSSYHKSAIRKLEEKKAKQEKKVD